MSTVLRRWAVVAAVVLLALGGTAWAANRTITVDFKYTDPDGNQKPVRWAWCELIDYDPLNDDVLKSGYTDGNGRVVFVYDDSTWDGIGGGRVDPFVRCYTRLGMPADGDDRHEVGWVTKKRRVSVTQLQLAYHELNTPRWDNNNQDRTHTTTATGETNHAFFIMDAIATANAPPQRPGSGGGYIPPMALRDNAGFCVSPVWVIYPSLLGTKFSALTNEVHIDEDHHENFDSIVHEYGHHEMYHRYEGVFGDYDRTQSDHSFNAPVGDAFPVIGADPFWTAFCEAWADFSPVITKRVPQYHGIDVEAPHFASASPRCEGTIVRVMWDICDRWDSHVVLPAGGTGPRLATGNMQLDDDPIGLAPGTPLADLNGLTVLKKLIRANRPKSLWQLRDAWNGEYANNATARRAFEAILWSNGIREGLANNTPTCTLSIAGPSVEATVNGVTGPRYTGDVTLTAQVSDVDADDSAFHHVTFLWTYVSPTSGRLYDFTEWNVIGVDVDGSDGFTLDWPQAQHPQNRILRAYVTAIASDCFDKSGYSLDPAGPTPGQVGPVFFGPAPDEPAQDTQDDTGGGTGGGTGTGGDTGPRQGTRADTYRHSNCATIVGWQWLRSNGANATWQFNASALEGADLNNVRLLFNGLITNQSSGGAGYSSVLTFTLRAGAVQRERGGTGATITVTVPTVNPYGRIDPNIRNGTGYPVYGTGGPLPRAFVEAARRAGGFTVELTWPTGVDNRYHVAVKDDAVTLGLSGGGTGGERRYRDERK